MKKKPHNPHDSSTLPPPSSGISPPLPSTYSMTESDLLEQEIRDQLTRNRIHDLSRQASLNHLNKLNRFPTPTPEYLVKKTTQEILSDNLPLQAAYARLAMAARDYSTATTLLTRSRFHVVLQEVRSLSDDHTADILMIDACVASGLEFAVIKVLVTPP